MAFFIGLLVIAVGVFMIMKTEWIVSFTGPIDWAEQHMGTEGGTRMFIKLLGVVIIIGAFLAATGLLGDWVRAIFAPGLQI